MVPLPPPPLGVAVVGGGGLSLPPSGCLRRKSRGPGRSSLGGVGRGGRGGRSASAEGPGGNKPPPRRELAWSGRRWALVFAAAPAPCAPWSRRLQNAQPLDVKVHSGASRSQGSGGGPHPSSSQSGARATGAEAQWEREPETPGPTLPQGGPPELARLPAREETHSSDHQEQTWRPQPWAWESCPEDWTPPTFLASRVLGPTDRRQDPLCPPPDTPSVNPDLDQVLPSSLKSLVQFGVLQQCLRTRVSPSLPPRKPRPFSGSLGLQHRCLLQPPKSGKPQTLRVLVTASLVVPGLLLHLFHCLAIALVQPRTIGRKRWRAAGDNCWIFPLVLSGFCEEYVAVSGVRVVSPSLPFGPHK
ncbi:striated muscle-specific serine/threonine-protein kinase-like [Trachypithecus francoisi]|uniref:striated muscle-specific serine/threonine-protein kinase-like n=1 Tax=Trachypithecus francoisi TaxID=54180 RepID=UPI00141B9501|nr:striated muscle-specific serine/threonine-protein kinase-like [Trachypithecus francoisi]